MADRRSGGQAGRTLLVLAALVVVIAGLKAARPILEPLLLGLFLAVLSFPFLEWLRRLGVRTRLAVVATVLADLAILIGMALLVRGAIKQFLRTAPTYLDELVARIRNLITWVEERGLEVSEWLTIERLDPGQFVDVARNLLGDTLRSVIAAVSDLTLVAVTLIFVLFELVGLPDKIRAAMGERADLLAQFESIQLEVQRYLGLKTLVSLGTGVIIGIWTASLGVDFPLLWGLIAFLLNFIPVVGSMIASVPAILVTLIEFDWTRALVVALGYFAVNSGIGNFVEPQLFGRSFGLSATVVLISLFVWGWMWGALGMILSVPLTMTIKIVCQNTERLRWVAVLLSPSRAPP